MNNSYIPCFLNSKTLKDLDDCLKKENQFDYGLSKLKVNYKRYIYIVQLPRKEIFISLDNIKWPY